MMRNDFSKENQEMRVSQIIDLEKGIKKTEPVSTQGEEKRITNTEALSIILYLKNRHFSQVRIRMVVVQEFLPVALPS